MSVLAVFVPGFFELLVICFVLVAIGIVPVLTFWMICTKAGFPGPLALLMLIPVGNIVLPLYIAFADWPALRDRP
jgi:hypothetical protein